MGEVYRARDTRLDRTVAIKVLPQQLAADPQFRERFDREARTISQLTHPHVCTLYDVGDHEGTAFLVMEYLEGETLAARIERGALKLDEALRLAMEIVSALDAAHRAGVVHRDLKPANVMLTKSSAGSASSPQAKLLDFGLAKAGASTVAGGLTMLPTTPAALTAQGTILGTFQYMAPEQIEGQEADARSDIWAFGCVLYEMLTGKRAFEAKTQATLIAAIVDRQPQPVSAVQPLTPPALDRVVAACLAKDPADRLQTAHDLLLQLRWIAEGGSAVGVPVPVAPVRRSHQRLAWTVAAVLGAGFLAASVVAVMHLRETPAPADPAQFTVAAPDKTTLAGRQLALSPDGRQLAVLVMSQGIRQIYVRPIGSLVGRLLQGSEEAVYPFWSADSRWLGFFAGGKLKKIQVSGGPAIVLCDAPNGRGGAWNHDNVILFAPTPGTPLMRVSAAGGEPAPVTTLETNENTHRWPYFLPDGEHFVFGAGNSGNAGARGTLKLSSLASRDVTTLFEVEGLGGYSAGHLLHVRGRTLLAQPFDLRSLRTTGDPFPVTDNLAIDGAAFAAVSGTVNGVIAYMRGTGTPVTALTWQDRGGKLLGTVLDPGVYNNLSLSPDERRLAVAIDTGSPPNRDVWIVDLARGVPTRLTFDPGSDGGGAWSSEGTRIALTSNRGGPFAIFTLSSTLPGTEKQLFDSKTSTYAPSWSADGRHLAFSNLSSSATGWDLWILPMDGDRKPYPFVQTPAQEDNAEFSPDGHWIAYSSTESSREEVYVRPFPGPGGQYQVSRAGGTQPQWRGDGRELFFLGLDAVLMATTVGGTQQSFEAGIPEALFETSVALAANQNRRQYAAAKDGKRFLVNLPYRGAAPQPVTVVLNWPAAIKP
jgi:Tol biopolymer transport system component